MKKYIIIPLTLIVMFLPILSNAQESWCLSDQMLKDYHDANPEMRARYINDQVANLKKSGNLSYNKMNGRIIIPTVVHVIHYNGIGNVSKAQIDDGIRIINDDFNKLNSDTSTVRTVFAPHITDVGIEFRLAKLDENGDCTEGVTRHNNYLTFNKRNEPKGIEQWSPYEYMNVWLVNSISPSTVLGFAQFPAPTAGGPSTYGIVVRADEWGSIELAASADGRTVTHEMGHAFNLLHTFQGSCGSFCQGSGDFVCDTPPQFDDNNNSCSFSLNTCTNDALGGSTANPNPYSSNVPDQLENYMGYGLSCLAMFTNGQRSRIYDAINNPTFLKLQGVTDTANARATGTNDGYMGPGCVPTLEVLTFDRFACVGQSISFTDDSYGGPLTTYNWSFPGGTPSSSSLPNPTITYNTPGNYDVVLRISNSSGIDSLRLSNYVHISDSVAKYSALNYLEGFENATQFANDWVVINEQVNPAADPTWERVTFVSQTGSASLWVNNLNSQYVTGRDELVSPTIKMSDVLNPTFEVDIAYRRRTSASNDKVNIVYSLDCGNSWNTLFNATPFFFAYDNGSQTSNFFPTQGSQWKTLSIPPQFIPGVVKNSDNVMFKFILEHGDGNNIYMDDFRILGQAVGLEDNSLELEDYLTIFPNPAQDIVNVNFTPIEAGQVNIEIRDLLGKKVKSIYNGDMNKVEYKFQINTNELPKGIYLVNIETNGEIASKKLVIN